jgi:histidinol-phosphatase (PHP family)
MKLYDQHLHSRHSFDSKTEPAANVETAISRGLAGLTFTEHFDTHPDDWPGCVYNDEAYSSEIERLRQEYGQVIFVGKGIEVCFQRDRMDFILDFLDRHTFDVVLLSVHYFGDRAVHVRENWDDVGPAEGTRRYLEKVLEAVRYCEKLHGSRGRVFDILSHLDFVKRYTKRWFDVVYTRENADLYDEILRTCLAADLIPEINTSTLRRGLDETMPGPSVVRRYAELGGTKMSLGSDAHAAGDVGAGFDRAVDMLREAGIDRSVWFREREPIGVSVG